MLWMVQQADTIFRWISFNLSGIYCKISRSRASKKIFDNHSKNDLSAPTFSVKQKCPCKDSQMITLPPKTKVHLWTKIKGSSSATFEGYTW